MQLGFCGASSSAFLPFDPFCVTAGTVWRRDFTEGWKSPLSLCACSLGVLLQLSKRFLQTLCRILEIRGGKTVSLNRCFQCNSAACHVFFPGTSSDILYKMSMSKQKPQLCSWLMIPDQSTGASGAHFSIQPPLVGNFCWHLLVGH